MHSLPLPLKGLKGGEWLRRHSRKGLRVQYKGGEDCAVLPLYDGCAR